MVYLIFLAERARFGIGKSKEILFDLPPSVRVASEHLYLADCDWPHHPKVQIGSGLPPCHYLPRGSINVSC